MSNMIYFKELESLNLSNSDMSKFSRIVKKIDKYFDQLSDFIPNIQIFMGPSSLHVLGKLDSSEDYFQLASLCHDVSSDCGDANYYTDENGFNRVGNL